MNNYKNKKLLHFVDKIIYNSFFLYITIVSLIGWCTFSIWAWTIWQNILLITWTQSWIVIFSPHLTEISWGFTCHSRFLFCKTMKGSLFATNCALTKLFIIVNFAVCKYKIIGNLAESYSEIVHRRVCYDSIWAINCGPCRMFQKIVS